MSCNRPLAACLAEVQAHCETLEARSAALVAENRELKARLTTFEQNEDGSSPAQPTTSLLPPSQAPAEAKLQKQVQQNGQAPSQSRDHTGTLPGSVSSPRGEHVQKAVVHDRSSSKAQKLAMEKAKDAAEPYRHGVTDPDNAQASIDDEKAAFLQREVDQAGLNGLLGQARIVELAEETTPTVELKHSGAIESVEDFIQIFRDSRTSSKPNLAQQLVYSVTFKTLCMSAIIANTVYLGMNADHTVKRSWSRLQGGQNEEASEVPDMLFCIWFSIEIIAKVCADWRWFLFGDDVRWNVFDFLLVLESIITLSFRRGTNVAMLRILRVFRLVRVVRLVRTVRALQKLRTMIFSILNCFADLMWAFVVILLIMFVFSIIFDNAVASFYDDVDMSNAIQMRQAEEMNQFYGSLYETMVTLWCSISGGNDWMEFGNLLRYLHLGEIYLAMFFFYIAFCTVGLLNVVTGIFVDSAVCTRTEDEVVEGYTEDLRRTSEEIKRLFEDADVDKSGTMSFSELRALLENPRVKAYFAGLDIDPNEARSIFTLIDVKNSGEITLEEFVNGTMKLKGHARSLDVVSLMYDHARYFAKFNRFCALVEYQLGEIGLALRPDLFDDPPEHIESMRRASSLKLVDQFSMSKIRRSADPSEE